MVLVNDDWRIRPSAMVSSISRYQYCIYTAAAYRLADNDAAACGIFSLQVTYALGNKMVSVHVLVFDCFSF